MRVFGLRGALFIYEVLEESVRCLLLTSDFIHLGFDGDNAVDMNFRVVDHIGRRHGRRVEVRVLAGEGTSGRCVCRGRGIRWDPEITYGVCSDWGSRLSGGILSYCKGYCMAAERSGMRDVTGTLAGDPKAWFIMQ